VSSDDTTPPDSPLAIVDIETARKRRGKKKSAPEPVPALDDVPHPADIDGNAPPHKDTRPRFELHESGSREGQIRADSQYNIDLALKLLGVSVGYDSFSQKEVVRGLDGFGPKLDDAAVRRLNLLVDERFKFLCKTPFFWDVLLDRARATRFHPVLDYLSPLKWDGVKRIDTWLVDYAGAEDSKFVRAVGRITLIAAVRRVRQPGCKFDEMLVLESGQGAFKSSAIAALAPDPSMFTDELKLDDDSRTQMEALSGKWIVEAGEMKGMSQSDAPKLKAFLSRQVDEARLAYARTTTVMPRQCIIIGTINETGDYLNDPTGNRRFWPVRVERFDVHRVAADRDQLWAEAAAAESTGESIRLDPSLYEAAAIEQEQRTSEEPFIHLLAGVLGDLTGHLYLNDLIQIAGLKVGDATPSQRQRLGKAIIKVGFDKQHRRHRGFPAYRYERGDADERCMRLVFEGGQVVSRSQRMQ
jgi:predicted P-loop ATPase